MDIFLTLLINLSPLYVLIALGFIGGRYLHIERDSLARVAIYMCMPAVMFGFVAQMEFQAKYILIIAVLYIIHIIVAFSMWQLGQRVYPDNRANLLAMSSAIGNTGYMGLPIVLMLFDQQWVAVYMLMVLSNVLCEATYTYYIAARSQFTVRKSIQKLFSFPVVYAVIAGALYNLSGLHFPDLLSVYWGYAKGAYVILGMMIIGVALTASKTFVWAPRFFGLVFLGKFALWPALATGFIALDNVYFHLFGYEVHKLMFILSIVPTAANVAAFSAQFNVRPEKAATTILLGTMFALIYIPLMLMAFELF